MQKLHTYTWKENTLGFSKIFLLPKNLSSLYIHMYLGRVARLCIFKPKISIWVNFNGLPMEDFTVLHMYVCTYTASRIAEASSQVSLPSPMKKFCTRK
jgi:hypothetical protein